MAKAVNSRESEVEKSVSGKITLMVIQNLAVAELRNYVRCYPTIKVSAKVIGMQCILTRLLTLFAHLHKLNTPVGCIIGYDKCIRG
jgi:hypothetical protein